jgi:hypothetical protein
MPMPAVSASLLDSLQREKKKKEKEKKKCNHRIAALQHF